MKIKNLGAILLFTGILNACAAPLWAGEKERLEYEQKYLPYLRCIGVYKIANNNFDVIRYINDTDPALANVLTQNYQELAMKMGEMVLIHLALTEAELDYYKSVALEGKEFLELHPLYSQLQEINLSQDLPMAHIMVSNCMYEFDLTYPDYN
jgi:hypothetical protein